MKATPYKTLFIFADQAAFDNRAAKYKHINGICQELFDAVMKMDEWDISKMFKEYDGDPDTGNKGCWNCTRCYSCTDCSFCYDSDECVNVIGAYNKTNREDAVFDQHNQMFDLPDGPSVNMCQVYVPNIFREILKGVELHGLEMDMWHGPGSVQFDKPQWECETTHCWAGWAVHLGGQKAYECENNSSTAAVAMNIFRRATPGIPVYHSDFYMPNDYAKMRIKECAHFETLANSEGILPKVYYRVVNFLRSLYHN
mgnify:CR=1 FL=1